MRELDLLIIGAGPAGLAAAREAKALGLEPVVIDENPLEEAWFRRQLPLFFGDRAAGTAKIDANVVYRWMSRPALQAAVSEGIEVLPRHASWGIFKPLNEPGFAPVTVGVHHDGATSLWVAKQLIIATGGVDLPLAFPGWELGGVMGGMAALRLFDTFGRIDGQRVVVLGSGALAGSAVVAAQTSGAEVVASVEIGERAQDGDEVMRRVKATLKRRTILRAEGRGEVERVVLTEVGDDGVPTGEPAESFDADTIIVAIGGQPAPEIPFMGRCEFRFDRRLGGTIPAHDAATMRTSHDHILVAGDAAGMPGFQPGGVARAMAQGRLAAISAAESLGRISAGEAAVRRVPVSWIEAPRGDDTPAAHVTPWHAAAWLLNPESVHLCRCEQVTKGTIAKTQGFYVQPGFPDEVKRYSRAGMGMCQGRLCRPIIAGAIADLNGGTVDTQPLAAWRPPVRPLPISALATEELTDYDRENELEPGEWIDWWFLGNYAPRDHGDFRQGESLG